MKTNIFRPIQFGKEVFHPQSFDQNSFVMNWTVEAGGGVPTHVHQHMDEHFAIRQGEVIFKVGNETITKKAGEYLSVPKGIPHSIKNPTKAQIGIQVTYSPCADTHRFFEVFATLDETNPGSVMNMMKYFYVYPRLGLKEFSTIQPPFAAKAISLIVTLMGKFLGWDKLVKQFENSNL